MEVDEWAKPPGDCSGRAGSVGTLWVIAATLPECKEGQAARDDQEFGEAQDGAMRQSRVVGGGTPHPLPAGDDEERQTIEKSAGEEDAKPEQQELPRKGHLPVRDDDGEEDQRQGGGEERAGGELRADEADTVAAHIQPHDVGE